MHILIACNSEDEKDAGEKAKRVRKKSEYRRPTLDLAATWCRNGCLQSLLDEQELVRTLACRYHLSLLILSGFWGSTSCC